MPGRSKRSPRHDDDLEYPTWDGRVNLSINGVTLTNEPTSEGAPYVDVMRVVHQVLHKSGLIPSWPARTDVPTVWPSQHARQLIRELQGRGVDGDTLLRMLIGLDPRQRLGLPLLVNQILSARRDDQTARERNRALDPRD